MTKDPKHVVKLDFVWLCPKGGPCGEKECEGHLLPVAGHKDDYELEVTILHPESCQELPDNPYRCATEQDIREWPESLLPMETGYYLVECWWSGPDWDGEYDGGCEYERLV